MFKNWIHFLQIFSLLLNMDKTSEKVTKDRKRVEAARKGREKYMNKLKESILNDAKKGSRDTSNASNETTNASNETTSATNNASNGSTTPAISTNITTPQDQMILMSMALACLLSLSLLFMYFLHITLSLKIKISSMKNRITHQGDVICFRKIHNK